MAKKEAKTDLWVYDLLKSEGIELDYQGCGNRTTSCHHAGIGNDGMFNLTYRQNNK